MSILNDPEHLLNEINTPNPREYCDFLYNLDYTLDLLDEVVVSFTVIDGELPEQISLNMNTGMLSGTAISPDDWDTEISTYLLNEYAVMDDDDTPFPDIPDLTVGELKSLPDYHLSGVNYCIVGTKAYYRDNPDGGPLSKFYFTIRLTTEYTDEESMTTEIFEADKEFFIQISPHYDPKAFLKSYGDTHNNLVNDDMEILSPEDYIAWRESQGHQFLSGCS